jgi:putative phosphoesterase
MKIGILSDTHNDIELTQKAINIFNENKVDLVVHAGDITSPRMLGLFKNFKCKFVLGNGDIDAEALNAESEKLGFSDIEKYCTFTADGKKIIVFHGNDVTQFRKAVASGMYDYVIKGHTHLFENYVSNKTRIINPGSLYGADEFSVAILDTESGRIDRIRIEMD